MASNATPINLPFLSAEEQALRLISYFPELRSNVPRITDLIQGIGTCFSGQSLCGGVFIEEWKNWSTNFLNALEFWGDAQPPWTFHWKDIFIADIYEKSPSLPAMTIDERTKQALREMRAEEGDHIFFTAVRYEILQGTPANLSEGEFELDANNILWYVGIHWPELAVLAESLEGEALRIVCNGGYADHNYDEIFLIEIRTGLRYIGISRKTNTHAGAIRFVGIHVPVIA